jgi:hypothetical protein
MYVNTYITHKEQRYEIYWTTVYALHILENFVADLDVGAHKGLDFKWIANIARKAMFVGVAPGQKDQLLHLFLTKLRGRVYETYAYLVPELDGRPPRCIVKTCYLSNKEQYRRLFDGVSI